MTALNKLNWYIISLIRLPDKSIIYFYHPFVIRRELISFFHSLSSVKVRSIIVSSVIRQKSRYGKKYWPIRPLGTFTVPKECMWQKICYTWRKQIKCACWDISPFNLSSVLVAVHLRQLIYYNICDH